MASYSRRFQRESPGAQPPQCERVGDSVGSSPRGGYRAMTTRERVRGDVCLTVRHDLSPKHSICGSRRESV